MAVEAIPNDRALDENIGRMPSGRVSGPDGWTRELVKAINGDTKTVILHMVNYMLTGGNIGKADIGSICPLQKCERRTRPIALMNFLRKCSEAWVAYHTTRLLNDLKLLDPSQFGFILSGGCPQPIFIVNALMEWAMKNDEQLYLILLDATEAYNSVPFEVIALAFRRMGATNTYLAYIWGLLQNQKWKLNSAYGPVEQDPLTPEAGVPQGGPLSPLIYIIAMDLINSHLRIHQKKGTGVRMQHAQFQMNEEIVSLSYADDLTLLTDTFEKCQNLLNLACEIFAFIGIKINPTKTV